MRPGKGRFPSLCADIIDQELQRGAPWFQTLFGKASNCFRRARKCIVGKDTSSLGEDLGSNAATSTPKLQNGSIGVREEDHVHELCHYETVSGRRYLDRHLHQRAYWRTL